MVLEIHVVKVSMPTQQQTNVRAVPLIYLIVRRVHMIRRCRSRCAVPAEGQSLSSKLPLMGQRLAWTRMDVRMVILTLLSMSLGRSVSSVAMPLKELNTVQLVLLQKSAQDAFQDSLRLVIQAVPLVEPTAPPALKLGQIISARPAWPGSS